MKETAMKEAPPLRTGLDDSSSTTTEEIVGMINKNDKTGHTPGHKPEVEKRRRVQCECPRSEDRQSQ